MEEVRSFGDYLDIFRRRKYWVIFSALILMSMSIVLAYWLPATYKSEGLILIESQEIPNDLVRSTVTSYADQRIAVIKQRLMTTSKILDIVERHNLYSDLGNKSPSTSRLVKLFRGNVEVEMVTATVTDPRSGRSKRASIAFTVSFLDSSPETAQNVANEMVTAFLNENIRVRTDRAAQTKSFLKVEADKFQSKLQKIEKEIGSFKDEYSESLPELLQYNLSAVERFRAELAKNQDAVLSLKDQVTTMSLQLTTVPVYLENQSNNNNSAPDVLTIEDQILELKNQYNVLITKYSENHPDVARIKRQLKSLEAESIGTSPSAVEKVESEQQENPAYVELKGRIDAAEREIGRVRFRQTEIKAKMVDFENRIFKTHQVKRIYDDLTRDHENTKRKYTELRAKQLEAELAENLESENKGESFTLIEPPLLPVKAEKPNRRRVMMAGFVVSIGLGFVIAFLIDFIFGGVRGYDKIAALAGRSPLVVIPIIFTKQDIIRKKTIRNRWLFLLFVLSLIGVAIFHFYVMNLEVLWFKVLNKISEI